MSQADRREMQERQEESQMAQQGLNHAQQMSAQERADEIHSDFLEELTESNLKEPSRDLLRNYLSKSFILANLRQSEVDEFKWQLRVRYEAFIRLHPRRESFQTGFIRGYVANDAQVKDLQPLTQQQKLTVKGFFDGIWMNVTRSKGFAQQEILQTSITQSIVDKGQEQSADGLLGRWRS